MTGTTRSSEGLSERRRKLLFRSWHRGIREMDLIMGGFADASIAAMTDSELDELERLLDVPDQEIYSWITGEGAVPARFRQRLVPAHARILTTAAGMRADMSRSPADLLKAGQKLTLANVADGAEGLVLSDLARAIAAQAGRAGDQPCGRVPRRPAHGGVVARAFLLRARPRRSWNSRPGIACLTTACRRMPPCWRSA